MKTFLFIPFFSFCMVLAFMSFNMQAQLVVNSSPTADELVQNLLGPGISYSNAVLTGGGNMSGSFTGGATTNLGVDQGIVLSSGNVMDIPNPASFFATTNYGYPGDPDLTVLAGVATHDASILEFDFVPLGDSLFFEYIFASEEYPEYVGAGFTDVFGFFIDGPKPGGGQYQHENVALVPGTQLPVSINTINHTTNAQYYIDNTVGTSIVFDGFTVVMKISLEMVPNQSYHIKLAVADGTDKIYDSGVFLKTNSFESPLPYLPLVEDGKEWDVMQLSSQGGIPGDSLYYTYHYKFDGDTLIEDLVYSKVYQYRETVSPDWYYYCAFREENKKVYMRISEDILKYDFGADVGDTLTIHDHSDPWEMIVESIDTVFVMDMPRPRFHLRYMETPDFTETWIEGIGSNLGPIESGTALYVGGWTRFLCMHHSGDLIYMNPAFNSCNMTNVGIEETEVEEIMVYPNPVNEVLGVRCYVLGDSANLSLYLYDSYGIRVKELPLRGNENLKIDVSDLPGGMYVLIVKGEDGLMLREKVLVLH